MKLIVELVDKDDEEKLNSHVMYIARSLLDQSKGQELMKALLKLFKENLNLKNYFKSLTNPSCSCAKSFELIVSEIFTK